MRQVFIRISLKVSASQFPTLRGGAVGYGMFIVLYYLPF